VERRKKKRPRLTDPKKEVTPTTDNDLHDTKGGWETGKSCQIEMSFWAMLRCYNIWIRQSFFSTHSFPFTNLLWVCNSFRNVNT